MSDIPQISSVSESLFPKIDLGDKRRNNRFAKVAQAIADNPGASFPKVFTDPTSYNACLNLLGSKQCTHSAILQAHREASLARMKAHKGPILLLHDGTYLDFTGRSTLEADLGQIGDGIGRGWLAHQTLAVDPSSKQVFGLLGQILHVRGHTPKEETVKQKRLRKSRESLLWIKGLEEMGPVPEGCYWVDVGDRGADIYEFLQILTDRKRRFIIRSCYNRALFSTPTKIKAEELLYDRLRALPAKAKWEFEVAASTGKSNRKTTLAAVSDRVTLRNPHVRKGNFRREPIDVTAVRVWETKAPAGEEPLEWLLLTNEIISNSQDLRRVVEWYTARMQIEEFHKTQKSGMGVENCQVQSVKKLAAVVGLLSVLSVALLNLRLAARNPEMAKMPASEIIPHAWIQVLAKLLPNKTGIWSVADFWVNLARLGGYLKKPIKHPPGWITLWRGWATLQPALRYHLATQKIP